MIQNYIEDATVKDRLVMMQFYYTVILHPIKTCDDIFFECKTNIAAERILLAWVDL